MKKWYGQTAYEAYCKTTDNKSLISGAELPAWDKLDWKIQSAWDNSALAVERAMRPEMGEMPNEPVVEGMARPQALFSLEKFGELCGIPYAHRVTGAELDPAYGIVRVTYERNILMYTGPSWFDDGRHAMPYEETSPYPKAPETLTFERTEGREVGYDYGAVARQSQAAFERSPG